jgi:3-hydroxyisobutyrate dehydrogenase-like beta-hydroxyacid dehydrogenase
MKVAIVGTGRMGSAMARSLARGGSELTLQNRTAAKAGALAEELGARTVASPAEAAADADVVISMLENEEAVRAAWSGPDGLLAGARSGSVLVDSSTVPPSVIQSFADDAASAGAGILDAPVSGSVPLAETGKLTIMAGGSAEDLDRARPALDQLATTIFHIGPLGTAAALKLAVNTLIFALNQSLSEALVLAERSGISREVAYDVFVAGAAGAPFVNYKKPNFMDPDGAPPTFSLDLTAKDLRLILELAESVGSPMPQTRVNQELVRAATEQFGPDRDTSIVAEHLRTKAREGVT